MRYKSTKGTEIGLGSCLRTLNSREEEQISLNMKCYSLEIKQNFQLMWVIERENESKVIALLLIK